MTVHIPHRPRVWAALIIVAGLTVATVLLVLTGGHPAKTAAAIPSATASQAGGIQAVAVPILSPSDEAKLPEATTFTKVAAPTDTSMETTDGTVAHPTAELVVFAAPGNTAFARLPVKQLGSPTWVPVIGQQPGWVQVLLPSKPNGSEGWVDASKVQLAKTPWLIRVRLTTRMAYVYNGDQQVGSWSAAIGATDTPTPTGRTFLLAQFSDPAQSYSPVIIALGTHSPTMDNYGGGPGTVAIHTWPDKSVYGAAVSHGCVRVPLDALRKIETIPLGTLVVITP